MYRARRREEAGEQVLGATRAMVMTALVTMASTFLFPSPVYSRLVVGLFLPLCLLLILLFRWGIFHAQGSVRSRRMHLRRVGLLAPEKDADLLRARSAEHEEYGFEILPLPPGAAVLRGREGGLQEAVFAWTQEERIAEVVLFEDWPGGETAPLIHRLARAGIPVRLVPRARDAIEAGTRMGDFLGFPALSVAGAHPAVRSWEKRAVDGALAIVSILLLGIPYLLVRLWLFATRRPIEKHEWIGRGGEVLRTGRLPGRWPRGAFFTGLRDFPRLGRWLVGQWSLVGIHPFEASIWPDLPETYRRFPPDAPPGWITLADRHGSRSAEQICAANREYVGRWSLALTSIS
ncbi:MAG: hypothetical protein QUU85_15270 [Candidatus Eisenbacteria bacterium]|nr:hypothetical protein [Candidatus Eisenbacteria bacterium]